MFLVDIQERPAINLQLQTPFLDRMSQLAAGMRTNFIQLQSAIVAARSRQLTPGRFVVLKDTDELALVLRYNDAEFALYPGHDYPLVVRTGLGEQECALDDLRMSPCEQAIAVFEDERQVTVRAVQGATGWALHDAQGRALELEHLVELRPEI